MSTFLKQRWAQDLVVYGVILLVAALMIFGIIASVKTAANPVTEKEVHWHAAISYEACGTSLSFDDSSSVVMGQAHNVIHGHNDDLVHVEGIVLSDEDITLEEFFKEATIDITPENLDTYKNGDVCEEAAEPGKVHFYEGEKEYASPKDIVIRDGQKIKVVFE